RSGGSNPPPPANRFVVGSGHAFSWPHRLEAQDTALSRLKHGFESRWGHHLKFPRVPRVITRLHDADATPAKALKSPLSPLSSATHGATKMPRSRPVRTRRMIEVYFDNTIVSAIAKRDTPTETAAIVRILKADNAGQLRLFTSE